MILSRQPDSTGKKHWTHGGARVLDGQGEVIVYLVEKERLDPDFQEKIFQLLGVKFADCNEIESFGIAFEAVSVLYLTDVSIIEIGAKGEITAWGF